MLTVSTNYPPGPTDLLSEKSRDNRLSGGSEFVEYADDEDDECETEGPDVLNPRFVDLVPPVALHIGDDDPLFESVVFPFADEGNSFSSEDEIDRFPQVFESRNLARRNLGLINLDFESSWLLKYNANY